MNSKVYLTQVETGHIKKYIHFSKDPELISAMGWKPFKSYQEQQFVDAVSKPSLPMFRCEDSIIYSIITVNDNVPIGFISLKGIDWDSAKAEPEIPAAIFAIRILSIRNRKQPATGMANHMPYTELRIPLPEPRGTIRSIKILKSIKNSSFSLPCLKIFHKKKTIRRIYNTPVNSNSLNSNQFLKTGSRAGV